MAVAQFVPSALRRPGCSHDTVVPPLARGSSLQVVGLRLSRSVTSKRVASALRAGFVDRRMVTNGHEMSHGHGSRPLADSRQPLIDSSLRTRQGQRLEAKWSRAATLRSTRSAGSPSSSSLACPTHVLPCHHAVYGCRARVHVDRRRLKTRGEGADTLRQFKWTPNVESLRARYFGPVEAVLELPDAPSDDLVTDCHP